MKKVDVAVQSYMKPESLLYTLMTLKEQSADLIDTVFINDDCSTAGVVERYRSASVARYFSPWKIRVRVNSHRTKWGPGLVRGYWPSYQSLWRFLRYGTINLYTNRRFFYDRENIRYQWALEQTDKKYLFVIHDDVEFRQNLLERYLAFAEGLTRSAIVGDLGQCWLCPHSGGPGPCTPAKISAGSYPSETWPVTGADPVKRKKGRACRINEWAALVSVDAARDILERERIFFGNYDDFGDVGAYWLDRALSLGYSFGDPIPDPEQREKWYLHGWQGHSGHSVWVNQGGGRKKYDKEMIEKRMQEKYRVVLP